MDAFDWLAEASAGTLRLRWRSLSYDVLRRGGRAVISDIVSDESVPPTLKQDPELWSGCISGAFQESTFLQAFAEAGFHGIELVKRGAEPWRTVNGIEFRSVTVRAWKGKQEPHIPVAAEEAKPFDCCRDVVRDPRETKGRTYDVTTDTRGKCEDGSCC